VYLPENNDRFDIISSTSDFFNIPANGYFIISITITMKCTTKVNFTIPIALEVKKKEAKKHFELEVAVESSLSSKLDYNDIVLGKQIGEGAFGAVYQGTYKGNSVAVKEYRSGIQLDDTAVQEALKEISIMEKLRSPYIIAFYGMTIGSHNSIVMELAELGSLASVISKHEISYPIKVRIALDCAKGMKFLHDNHIIHRDLKPENLLVFSLELDSPQLVKITDFGTGRMISDEVARSYTQNLGTPSYTSPEILNNDPYSLKTDVYSYGILLWSLYCQEKPYSSEGISEMQMIKYVLEGNRPKIPDDMRTEYKDLMVHCWKQDPDERPSFDEVVSLLEPLEAETEKELKKKHHKKHHHHKDEEEEEQENNDE